MRQQLSGPNGPSIGSMLRSEYLFIGVIAVLPFAFIVPGLLHIVATNPAVALAGITKGYLPGFLPGYAYVDPNVGYTAQALGHLDATDLLHGIMPWWNPYSGVGMPLDAELQSAPFFPLTLLLALHGGIGILLEHPLLQAIAGIGTYMFLRKLGLAPSLSLVGGLLFAFNGTYAWFGDNPIMTLTLIPWVLLGTEVGIQRIGQNHRWQLLSIATALMLLAGFPETAYVDLVLAGLWALVRTSELPRTEWLSTLGNLLVGVAGGFALAAFSLVPFAEALKFEYLGGHAGSFASAALPSSGVLQGLIAPYIAGPIFAVPSTAQLASLSIDWGNLGGYVTPVLLILAAYGVARRPDRRSIALTLFTLVCLGRTYGLEPLVTLFNLLPEASRVAAFRYANPSWELALIVVALRGLDPSVTPSRAHQRVALLTAALCFVLLAVLAVSQASILIALAENATTVSWLLWSLLLAVVTALAVLGSLLFIEPHARTQILAGVLVANALMLFAIPIASNPRAGAPDGALLNALHHSVHDGRIYSLVVFEPNYGAYYRIPSIDFNYLPLPKNLVAWVNNHVEPGFATSPVTLNGSALPSSNSTPWQTSLALHLPSYEALAVSNIVIAGPPRPLVATLTLPEQPASDHLDIPSGDTLLARLNILRNSSAELTSVTLLTTRPPMRPGVLDATLCSGRMCIHSSTSPAAPYTSIVLPKPLPHHPGEPVTLSLAWQGSGAPLTVASALPQPGYSVEGLPADAHGMAPQITLGLSIADQVHPVYTDSIATVYRLDHSESLFAASGGRCRVIKASTYRARISCQQAGSLIYREDFFPGWTAVAGPRHLDIHQYDQLFMRVVIPRGTYEVSFAYTPPHEVLWIILSILALFTLLGTLAMPWPKRTRNERTRNPDLPPGGMHR